MGADTVTEGLQRYGVGQKVRVLRRGKKLGLVELGRHTGLSPGMLSKIERGQLFPTLPTLLRIAMVFDVGLEHFFVDAAKRRAFAVVRRAERLRLPDSPDSQDPAYFFESLDFPVAGRRMQAYLAEFPAVAPASAAHEHPGEELVFVIEGRLTVVIEDEAIVLDAGDALHLDPSAAHSYRGDGGALCRAIVVVAPEAVA
ncbi:MAG: helix-turn-helix domain-containing protein [Alphaproteobacteria bacterium]